MEYYRVTVVAAKLVAAMIQRDGLLSGTGIDGIAGAAQATASYTGALNKFPISRFYNYLNEN